MTAFLQQWEEAALTTLGFFWMALWAFCLGYIISSLIQVFVTRERMRRSMGESGGRAVALAAFFGFISSSCSFAALSTTRALFQKGAGLAPALAFLLASTNLVIELGLVIFIFLSWQFVVGEYVGGILLILVMWLVVRLTLPRQLVERAREQAKQAGGEENDGKAPDWRRLIRSRRGWRRVGHRYFMEWHMVWKDVTFGFTVAGVIAAFVPPAFFQWLFVGSGSGDGAAWWQIALHTLIGPLAAFFTFIGSMGNIPLAAVLFGSGVSFAGIMAFIFSDLVVFPVLRISARYFGWRMALYIVGVFLVSLVVSALVLHGAFAALDLLPERAAATTDQLQPTERFSVDYTLFLNIAFLLLSFVFAGFLFFGQQGGRGDSEGQPSADGEGDHSGQQRESDDGGDEGDGGSDWLQRLLLVLAIGSILWLALGVLLWLTPLGA